MRVLQCVRTAPLALALWLAACGGDPASVTANSPRPSPRPAPPPPVGGDADAGRRAFARDCAGCHASGDGFDLAFFGFDDATIVRRAAPHVDSAAARDIVAHVRALGVTPVGRDARPFQPAGAPLADDVAFAVGLFGRDAWPAELGTAELRAIDPLGIAAAVPLPLWSIETNNRDWMPDAPPPPAVLDFPVRGVTPRAALALYDTRRTVQSLVAAVVAVRSAERAPENSGAPCVTEPMERFEATACFDVRRWTSSLVAQHMLREGLSDPIEPVLHDVWWDVGNAARHAGRASALENRERNWAVWMYLGWIFEPGRHASTYLANGLSRLDLPRHATFVALKAQVSRPPGRADPYADALTAARMAPQPWTADALRFAYRHLLERLGAGDVPPVDRLPEARDRVRAAFEEAAPKLAVGDRAQLAELRDEVLSSLP